MTAPVTATTWSIPPSDWCSTRMMTAAVSTTNTLTMSQRIPRILSIAAGQGKGITGGLCELKGTEEPYQQVPKNLCYVFLYSYGGGTERTWTPTSSTPSSSMGSSNAAHSSGQTSHAPLKVHFGAGNKVIKPESSLIIRPATAVVVRPNASFPR